MVRFLPSAVLKQQHSAPQSPAAQKKMLTRSAPCSPAAKYPVAPDLVEPSPDASCSNNNASPASTKASLRLVFPFPSRNRCNTEDALFMVGRGDLRLADTCSTDDASAAMMIMEENEDHAAHSTDDDDDDLGLPNLHTMTTDENPFQSNSPGPVMVQRKSLSEQNVARGVEACEDERGAAKAAPASADDVSSISNDSRRRFVLAAAQIAAARQQGIAVVEDDANNLPPVPMEISIPSSCAPTPQWLRIEEEDSSSPSHSSSGLSSLPVTPDATPRRTNSGLKRSHRRSSSAGIPLPPLLNHSLRGKTSAAAQRQLQPSRSLTRPSLRKHQSAPPTSSSGLVRMNNYNKSSGRHHHLSFRKDNMSSPISQTTITETSISGSAELDHGLSPPLLETWLEQASPLPPKAQLKQQPPQDALLGDRPRRIDPVVPHNTTIITIGSIVGQSSVTRGIGGGTNSSTTQTSSAGSTRSSGGGEHNSDGAVEDEMMTNDPCSTSRMKHRRRKSNTLAMLSLGLATPVRRLVTPSDPNAKSKVDLRRATGCLT